MSNPESTCDGGSDPAPHDQPASAPGENSAGRLAGRYVLGEGEGSVHAVRDRILDRTVRGRVVPTAGADDLEQEARFLARLDHAGTPAVLDFVRGDAGAMLIERSLDGPTLEEAIARARVGEAIPGIETPGAVVQTILKMCDAVSAAHARGVVHHAIAPGLVRLAPYGQVVLADWSAAIAERSNPATLRFVSAVTDAKALALDGLHADLRALGACLFMALTLRPSCDGGAEGPSAVTPDERLRVPPAIEAIARRALRSDPTQGYATVADLAADLRRCADGMAPSAYDPGSLARLAHWAVRRRRAIATTTAVVVAVAAGWLVLAWPRLSEAAAWSEVDREGFSDTAYRERWVEPPTRGGMFTLRDGRLVSTADRDACLVFRQRLSTPVAIEYTGEILPGSQPCDLSVLWSESEAVAEHPELALQQDRRGYMIQAGAFGDTFCAIYQNPGRRLMAHANRQLETGRRYRFRVELSGTGITMDIDGERVLQATDLFPSQSGYLSLYGFYPGKAFDDVRIVQRSPANPPTRLDAGDAAFHEHRFAAAEAQYRRVAEALRDGGERQQALFRAGLAAWYGGSPERASLLWKGITDPGLSDRVAGFRLESLFNADQRAPHTSWIEERYAADPARRPQLREQWRQILQQQLEAPQRSVVAIDYLLGVHRRLFPQDATARFAAASALIAMQRYADVLSDYPEQHHQCARAQLCLGRSADLLASDRYGTDERIHAHGMRGEFQAVVDNPGAMAAWRLRSLIRLDRLDEALREPDAAYPVLLFMGRGAQVLDMPGLAPAAAGEALVSLGRLQEAAGERASPVAMLMLGQLDLAERVGGARRTAIRYMEALEHGDAAAALALRDALAVPADLSGTSGWFSSILLLPFTDRIQGDAQACERRLRPMLPLLEGIYAKSAWHVARAVLGDDPPAAVAGMPARYEGQAWQRIAEGMRAEVTGDPAGARAAYAAFTAMPIHRRLLANNQPDADVEWFVAWRLRALAGGR